MVDRILAWATLIQSHRDELDEGLTALTLHRRNLDDFLCAFHHLRVESKALIASSGRVSRNPVWRLVSAYGRQVYDNIQDSPTDPAVRRTRKALTKLVRKHEDLVLYLRERVREEVWILEEMIVAHANQL